MKNQFLPLTSLLGFLLLVNCVYAQTTPGQTCITFTAAGETIQNFQVPAAGVNSVTITAVGADGGEGVVTNSFNGFGGSGATAVGTFSVMPLDMLDIVVGLVGEGDGLNDDGAGGGGSGVRDDNDNLLVVAGAGGGGSFSYPGYGGQSSTSGGNGGSTSGLPNGPSGGINGLGGSAFGGGGGGGVFSAGADGSFAGGGGGFAGIGGMGFASGGFGVGGGGGGGGSIGGGGGGGYSGGGGGDFGAGGSSGGGGGGGSFAAAGGTGVSITAGTEGGGTNSDGSVVICYTNLCPILTPAPNPPLCADNANLNATTIDLNTYEPSVTNSVGGPIAGSCSWTFNGSPVAILNPVTVSNGDTYCYTFDATNGCSESVCYTFIVNPLPTAILTGGGTVCPPATSTNDVVITFTGAGPWDITYTVDGANPVAVNNIAVNPFVISGSGSNPGSYQVTSITDANGCTTMAGYVSNAVTVAAGTLTASCRNITEQIDGNGFAAITGGDIDDNSGFGCNSAVGLTRLASPAIFTCADLGPNTVTLSVFDPTTPSPRTLGVDSATCVSIVTVEDNIAPSIVCATNAAKDTDIDECYWTVPDYQLDPLFRGDNCTAVSATHNYTDGGTYTASSLAGAQFPKGQTFVTWTVTDQSGNQDVCTMLVDVSDNQAPVINCADYTDIFEGCPGPIDPNTPNGEWTSVSPDGSFLAFAGDVYTIEVDLSACASDNCTDLASLEFSLFSSDEENTSACTVTIVNEYSIRDASGNISDDRVVTRHTIEDTTSPDIIFVPQAMTIACDGSSDPANTGTAIATDICTPTNQIAITFNDVLSGTLCGGQSITRTWTATDLCGLSSTAEQIITILSPDAPMISCPDLMVVECFSDINPSADNATVTTPCTVPTVTVSAPELTSGTADCNGSIYTVTYTVTDGCGQTASCTQEFAIVNDGPTIACAADETVECMEDINPTDADVAVMTSCDVDSDIDISEATIFGQDGCSGTVYQFTYTVTDICGRVASCTRSYTLENDGPEITAPADETVECASDINVDAEDAELEYACALDGDVVISGPVQVGDDDCPGTTYTYTYTVTDECGRSASDEQVFTIDNAGPTIASPADETVECAFDIATDAGAAVVTTSCTLGSNVVISGPVRVGPENCPGTTYTYTYIVTDDCGRTASDDQVFTIGENDEPTIDVVPTITVDCFESINPDPAFADVTTACGNGVDYDVTVTDPVLGFGLNCPGETYSVTYTITDACGRMASAVQTYTIANDGPTMECPDNCEVLTCYDGDYEAIIEAWINTVEATSSCSVDLAVFNTYNGVNGICVSNGFTPVTFSATDACGRSVSCESGIFITDTDAPDIYETPQDLLVPCTANTTQIFSDWLADYGGAEAVDACGGPVTWSADTGVNALNCANGPQAIVVTFTATDGCGNSASVVGTFNTKLLPNAVNVAGLIQTEAAEAVSSVEVSAYQSTGMTAMDLSDDNGDYNFEEFPYEENTEIVPSRDGDYLNGVSTYDLILLQQHILDIQNLDSPYKRIAADVNRSGTISTLDLVLLRRLILHIDEELADNTSWRFVDADFVFPNPTNPFETDFPEAYNLSGEEEELKDFVAVKIGDLNLDAWTSSYSQSDDRSGLEELIFEVEDQKLKAGQTYAVEINAQNFEAIRGFQMTLDYDQSLIDVLNIERGALTDFSEANYNLASASKGAVPMSWSDEVAQDLSSGDAAFRIIIKAKADVQLSEALAISSSMTKAEAYSNSELMNVSLNFSNNGSAFAAQALRLYQNQPNPFKDVTTIGFQLPEASEVTLEIYDVAGKLLYAQRGDFAAGFNQIDVNRSDLQAGILYYQVSTASNSESKKMIVLD